MQLTVLERILLLNILPVQGDITTVRLVREAREDLSFSDAENKTLKFAKKDNQMRWETEQAPVKEVSFNDTMTGILAAGLKELDKKKELGQQHISLYEKFIETKTGVTKK